MTIAALVQTTNYLSKSQNIEKAARLVKEAASKGAQIVCLQELFNTIYFCHKMDPRFYEEAEPIPGPTIEQMARVAEQEKIVLVAPIYEKAMEGLLYNTAVVLGPDGAIIGTYRKSSIPLTTGLIKGYEKYYFTPGDTGFRVFETPFGLNIGILICYDRHFPEAARTLALRGADLILVPTATGGGTRYLWEIELQGHAVDNILYVGGVNRVGVDEGDNDTVFFGSSFFVNPRGEILTQADDKGDAIVYADIDLGIAKELRNAWGFFRDRRPDLYGAVAKVERT